VHAIIVAKVCSCSCLHGVVPLNSYRFYYFLSFSSLSVRLPRFGDEAIRAQVFAASSSCRALVLGGEPFPSASLIHQWWPVDSKTEIYNIYGTTECSCWATLYNLTRNDLLDALDQNAAFPLGEALDQTQLVVHDEITGQPVNEYAAVGELYIGSSTRYCYLNFDATVKYMRSTGDIVSIQVPMRQSKHPGSMSSPAVLVWLKRKDRRVKRLGHLVNLDETATAILSKIERWQACYVVADQAQLLCFFIDSQHAAVNQLPQLASTPSCTSRMIESVASGLCSTFCLCLV
jgi:acyl-coenzyme A synthetase/AMP-(fatty) acid ligase